MRHWIVGGGLLTRGDRLLLVQNLRRDGSKDWSTPGGVIDEGESIVEGLTREVAEETGLVVTEWSGPTWTVAVAAPEMQWTLEVEVHHAVAFDGDIAIDDPDGIVIAADWLDLDSCAEALASSWLPTREPMLSWFRDRTTAPKSYRYELTGRDRSAPIKRLD